MIRPVRLKLSRARGFDLQAASLAINGLPGRSCARPHALGNPFGWQTPQLDHHTGRVYAVRHHREWLDSGKLPGGTPRAQIEPLRDRRQLGHRLDVAIELAAHPPSHRRRARRGAARRLPRHAGRRPCDHPPAGVVDRRKKKIGRLKRGDRVLLDPEGQATITHAAPEDGATVRPHRASASRDPVPAWYVIWRAPGSREAGGLFDPADEVYVP